MIKKWAPTVLGVMIVLGILMFAFQQIFVKTTLSEQEIINRVESLYNGSVEDITKNAKHYNVVFSDGTKVYEVQVDEEQGAFRDLTLIADRGESVVLNSEQDAATTNNNEQTAPTEKSDTSNPNAASAPATRGNSNSSSGTQSEQPAVTPPTKPLSISEAAAEQIALKQLHGEVEDIGFFASADGGYYIVEIETNEQEAAFQIHAITGKILSVVYDD